MLVTCLTKKMAEDLTDYYHDLGIRVRYLHADIETIERVEIIRGLRKGDFDVLVGINLLREGLDLPEVSLVAILDADKEGFLRAARSLIQTTGRAARHLNGRVIMYADTMTEIHQVTPSSETDRRRAKQVAYNEAHGIPPLDQEEHQRNPAVDCRRDHYTVDTGVSGDVHLVGHNLRGHIADLEKRMRTARRQPRIEG